MNTRKIVVTKDGTTTIQLTTKNEHYHSIHGALDEAKYVFIEKGLQYLLRQGNLKKINLLEVGFGTGLNSLLTFLESQNYTTQIYYTGIEAFPVKLDEIKQLNFHKQLGISEKEFLLFHETKWGNFSSFSEQFHLLKWKTTIEKANLVEKTYDLIYFDAFGYRTHPEIWHLSVLHKIVNQLNKNGVFVTYSAMGQLRRDLISCGLQIERLQGPPGKREMLRGIKI